MELVLLFGKVAVHRRVVQEVRLDHLGLVAQAEDKPWEPGTPFVKTALSAMHPFASAASSTLEAGVPGVSSPSSILTAVFAAAII